MKNIKLYSTDFCAFCVQAKRLLEKLGHSYEEINLSRDPAGRTELVESTGMMTFPQVLIDGQLVGGYRELVMAERSGKLDELLAA
jgi:glutaredoxin 3